MTRISDFTEAGALSQNDALIVDGPNGTRKLSMTQGFGRLADTFAQSAWFHSNIYRGKPLGSSFTEQQKSAIASGTFDDLYVGDFWRIGGMDWIIADFDYWLNIGVSTSTIVTQHHIAIVPRFNMGTSTMNPTATNEGGYVAAQIRTKFASIVSQVGNGFGTSNILTIRRPFSSGADMGMATQRQWIDARCELMSERMVYGSPVFEIQNGKPASSSNQNSAFAWNHTADLNQIALFRIAPRWRIAAANGGMDNGWWLSTMAKYDHFCCCVGGTADCRPANEILGVRPILAITG